MARIVATPRDMSSGCIAQTTNLISKLHPNGKIKLSAAQEFQARFFGYRNYHEFQSLTKAQRDHHDQDRSLTIADALESVCQAISALWEIPLSDAMDVAKKLRLEELDVFQGAPRNPLGQAVHAAARGQLPKLSPGDLIRLGAPGFTYTVAKDSSATFVWSKLAEGIELLSLKQLQELHTQPKYMALANLSEVRDAYIRDILIPASSISLEEASRTWQMPVGYELISLFNELGEFRGRCLYNSQLRGLIPLVCHTDELLWPIAKLLAGAAPFVKNPRAAVEPGKGKGQLMQFNASERGSFKMTHVDEVATRLPDYTYVEYAGAEQVFTLASHAKHHEMEVSTLISNGAAHLVKCEVDDLVALPGVCLSDLRFEDYYDNFMHYTFPFSPDGRVHERTGKTDALTGDDFREHGNYFVRAHKWVDVDDLPGFLLAAMGPLEKVPTQNIYKRGTDALPRDWTDRHYHFDGAMNDAIRLGRQFIASSAGTQDVVDMALGCIGRDASHAWAVQYDAAVASKNRVDDDSLIKAGQQAKAVIPALDDAFSDLTVGLAVVMSDAVDAIAEPGVKGKTAQADVLSWLAVSSALPNQVAMKPETRALLLSKAVMDRQPLASMAKDGEAIDAFIERLADQHAYLRDVKQWRAGEANRWTIARESGYSSVGLPVDR